MGYAYVYNLGSADDTQDTSSLDIERGLFFDGTANNHRNVEIRKKIQQIDEYADQSKLENRAIKEEKDAYNDYGLERTYKNLWWKKVEADNSFKNDFSNVARLWRGVNQDEYGIYIEGIGTEDEKDDVTEGLSMGAVTTGIRTKVRKACEELAKQISDMVKKNDNRNDLKTINILLDVFGFSRGAAAARNFLYEINGYQQKIDKKVSKKRGVIGYQYAPEPFIGETLKKEYIYGDIYIYKDDFQVNEAYLTNEEMPRMGYLGYFLLEKGLTKEEIQKIILRIRFVGLYDTVSSYEKDANLIEKIRHTYKNHLFLDDVEQLQLNNLGIVQELVHFTAMDEFRENFDLTNISRSNARKIMNNLS